MLKSKKGYLASEILDYPVIDRHSKIIGRITDLFINNSTQLIEYIIIGNRGFIPVSFIDNDDSTKRVITLSQPKERLNQTFSISKVGYFFTEIKKSTVYDITGSVLGKIADIAYYPGLKVDFLVRKEGPRILFPNYFVIPVEIISYFHQKSIVVNVSKDELGLVNFTGFQQLFSNPWQDSEDKRKQYVIVEAPVSTVSFYVKQREEALKKTTESEYLFIEQLDVSKAVKVSQFVKLFNLILASSPDTFIPISEKM
ncbi:MAG: PRC-barrel domain-containing protein [Candidatus Hodarchaeales archaeon]|jgi:sporulation protein YlmC with PRC-barrel domain